MDYAITKTFINIKDIFFLMVNKYRCGRIGEKKIVNWLKSYGFRNIRRSKGSRGPADIYAVSPSGTKTYIQVKTKGGRFTREEKLRLRQLARQRKGFAAYVHYYGDGKVKMVPLGNWRKRKG